MGKQQLHYLHYVMLSVTIVYYTFSIHMIDGFRISSKDSNLPLHLWHNEIGEPATLKFLTTIRRKRDIVKNDYHIVDVSMPNSNRSFRMHLVKSESTVSSQLLLLIHDGNSSITVSENISSHSCLYMGTTEDKVKKIGTGNSTKQNYMTATISMCGQNNRHQADYNGLIISGDELFILNGVTQTDRKTIPHTIFQTSKINKSRKHDVLHVPKQELERAIEEMKTRNKERTKETENMFSTVGTTTTEEPESEDSVYDNENEVEGDSFNNFDLSVPALRVNSKAKGKGSSKPVVRSKKMVIEIAVFTDPTLFRKLKMKTSKETIQRIKNVALATVNNMNLLYKQPSLGIDISLRLIRLEIMKGNPKNFNTHNGHASKYLSSFCKYAGDKNKNGDLWDHALMLTGLDLGEGGDNLTVGLAWAGTMCLRYWSCSLSEGYSFGSVFTITHEIGHSLGMEHDGYGPSRQCNPEKYLMSATTGIGKVEWSKCSSSNVKQFIKTGNPEVGKKDPKNKPGCLNRVSPMASKALKFNAGKLPGQKYDSNSQCRLECGAGCSPYVNTYYPYNNICAMLFCQKTNNNKQTYVQEAHPALEGTKCGDSKHCRGGKCVQYTANGK